MKSTSHQRAPLARGHRDPRCDPRIAERRLRVALARVIDGHAAPEPAYAWHDNSRTDPRAPLPCEKERAMLAAAIRAGATTRDAVLTYYLARIADTLAEFPDAHAVRTSDVLYVRAMAEIAEATEATMLAHTCPDAPHRERAVRELREAIECEELVAVAFERGGCLATTEAAR